ncbi:MAG TPA: hypothetical protein VL460_00805 [Caulobacteraceae bacterium]|nr:hypothetical protein [Caulobacteraceae bacterium]
MIGIATSFGRDRAGVAAVELALIAPVIAAMALVSYEVWQVAARTEDMRTALQTGAQYYMNGGTSDTAAQALAISSWENAPPDAAVGVSRACVCGQAAQVCTLLCSDGAPPASIITLSATATRPQAMFSKTISTQRVVRVR